MERKHNPSELIDHARECIRNDNLEDALKFLLLVAVDRNLSDQIIVLFGRLNSYRSKERVGTIGASEELELNRIRMQLTSICSELEAKDSDKISHTEKLFDNKFNQKKTSFRKIFIPLLVTLSLGFIIFFTIFYNKVYLTKLCFDYIFDYENMRHAPYAQDESLACYKFQGKWSMSDTEPFLIDKIPIEGRSDIYSYTKSKSVSMIIWCLPDTKGRVLDGIEFIINEVYTVSNNIQINSPEELASIGKKIGEIGVIYYDKIQLDSLGNPSNRIGTRVSRYTSSNNNIILERTYEYLESRNKRYCKINLREQNGRKFLELPCYLDSIAYANNKEPVYKKVVVQN